MQHTKHFYIAIIFLICCQTSHAQFVMRHQLKPLRLPDSTDIAYYSPKKFGTAAGMVFTLNMGVWAFDRYVLKGDYAYIDIHTIKKNLTGGFKWDNDNLGTNMFFHPYHGNLYYNAARSNGYNYWASGAFAFAGSAMWELFMENEAPSINDIFATPIGGMAIGEVTYRTSDLLIDDRTKGWNRFGRELGIFLIDPTRGLSRILSGDAWRRRATRGQQFGMPLLSIEISTGMRVLELRDDIFDKGAGFAMEVSLEYGDKFDHEDVKPYDFFSFRANINGHSAQPAISQVNVIGQLWGTSFQLKKHYLGIGIYQYFDFYDSDTISTEQSNKAPYKFGAPASFGIGFYHRNNTWKRWTFDSYGHINAILMGASLSDHYLVDNRNYNLGNGFGWKCGINVCYQDKLSLSLLLEGFRLYTHKGYPENCDISMAMDKDLNAQGDASNATFNISSLIMQIKLFKQVYLTMSSSAYQRTTRYKYFPQAYSFTGEGKFMLTYKF